jgi:GTP-binding protein Era
VSSEQPSGFRCGYVAIAGLPNVGKSTLLNALMGMKLSIITRKPQTTRRNVIGILTDQEFQAILVDTPGLLDPSYRLHRAMQTHARSAIQGADTLLLMVDATRAVEGSVTDQISKALAVAGDRTPVILALNKVDRVPKPQLLPMMQQLNEARSFSALVPVSALKGEGLSELLGEVIARLPVGPPLYPPDVITEHPERFFVAELVREAVFERFSQEIPYATMTQVEEFRRKDKKTYIRVVIYVERESQRPIVLGKGGRAIKAIGKHARGQIEDFLGEPVYLDLWVKVREGWREQDTHLRELDLI